MANITIKIEGLDALRGAFRRFPTISEKYLQKGIDRSIAIIHNLSARQKGIVPVLTGNLSNSFSTGIKLERLKGSIRPTAKYAKYVNDGTRRMKPRRYMEKLAETATPKIQKEFNEAVEGLVNEIAKQAK